MTQTKCPDSRTFIRKSNLTKNGAWCEACGKEVPVFIHETVTSPVVMASYYTDHAD